jgi:hypothetical protein
MPFVFRCLVLHGEGPRSRCYGRTAALRIFVQPYDEDEDEQFFYQVLQGMEHQWNEIDRGKPTTPRKTCPSANLSTTNPTWTDPGSNPGLRSGRPATNSLSHGTAIVLVRFLHTTCSIHQSIFRRHVWRQRPIYLGVSNTRCWALHIHIAVS